MPKHSFGHVAGKFLLMLDKFFSKKRRPQHSKYYVKSDHIRLSFESCLVPPTPAPGLDTCPCSDEEPSLGANTIDTLGVSIIEPSIPAPILVSDASIEDFQRCLPKGASEPPSPRPAGPRSTPPQSDVEELYFNSCAKSNPSVSGKPDTHQECKETLDFSRKHCYPRRDGKKPAHSMPLCKIMQESGGASSAGEAAWGADARANYYHNKLLSTLKVLENREETVRVQGESLRVAESRIAALAARADRLRDQLQRQAQELQSLRLDKSRAERADAAAATEAQDSQHQNVVRCLQTNLAIIEDLYRECFYETVKQEELIETLRESYLEEKRPRRAHPQDITTEVDSLKLDISNFLNNSNSDSGVWERGEGGEEWAALGDELRHITGQLLRLRDMLADDCTCGLEEENMRLKNANETLEIQLSETRHKLSELEATLAGKEDADQYKKEIEEKSKELHNVIQQMVKLEESVAEKNTECDTFSRQLQQSQVSLEDQSKLLAEAKRREATLETTVMTLKKELQRANDRAEESRMLCEELRSRESSAARQLARARAHVARLDDTHREQTQASLSLQAQLQEAHARGAALCAEVRAVVAAVHHWLRWHRTLEDKIKEQEAIIKSLQHTLEIYQKEDSMKDKDDSECCPKCVAGRRRRCRTFESDTASCSKWRSIAEERRNTYLHTSGSEMASPSSVPTPPQRLRKQSNFPCAVTEWRRREVAVQRPQRRDAAMQALPDRSRSPSWELEQRMSALTAALDHAQPRWAQPR